MAVGSSKNVKFLRFGGFCGILGSGLSLTLVLAATILSPWFSWENNALSELGVGEVSLLFNGAMLIGGVIIFFFALGLREYFLDGNRLVRVGVNLVIVASILLALVSVFIFDMMLMHGIVSLGPLLLAPLGFVFIGFGTEETKIRKFSIGCGVAALVSILILPMIILFLPFNAGFAVPEIINTAITTVWLFAVGTELIKHKN
ncbi:MAG TPA: DUF998 domain-containing protein [Candidatus Bathyarchaeota archaeon]|mgnify:CR=1 FL=1|nr:DUF998 domain-containing protein [Candidatus Bathyarchaeota archaeon]